MKRGNQANALLVELLIVILFFMLGATILIRVFGKSYELTSDAETAARALVQAQNIADTLYASKDVEGALRELGFEALGDVLPSTAPGSGEALPETDTGSGNEGLSEANTGSGDEALPEADTGLGNGGLTDTNTGPEVWIRHEEDYELRVTAGVEELDHGRFVRMQVEAIREEEVLISLPCSRYEGEEALAE